VRPGQAIIDVGGGTSRLADGLLEAGLGPLSVLDLSARALERSQARLGKRADDITWINANITRWIPPQTYRFWHDRAVFHFLTRPQQRAAYVANLRAGLAPGGHVLIWTFADDGPEKCSGLPVQRCSPQALAAELDRHAPGILEPVSSERHDHVTPMGKVQRFQGSLFRRL